MEHEDFDFLSSKDATIFIDMYCILTLDQAVN